MSRSRSRRSRPCARRTPSDCTRRGGGEQARVEQLGWAPAAAPACVHRAGFAFSQARSPGSWIAQSRAQWCHPDRRSAPGRPAPLQAWRGTCSSGEEALKRVWGRHGVAAGPAFGRLPGHSAATSVLGMQAKHAPQMCSSPAAARRASVIMNSMPVEGEREGRRATEGGETRRQLGLGGAGQGAAPRLPAATRATTEHRSNGGQRMKEPPTFSHLVRVHKLVEAGAGGIHLQRSGGWRGRGSVGVARDESALPQPRPTHPHPPTTPHRRPTVRTSCTALRTLAAKQTSPGPPGLVGSTRMFS